MASPGHGDRDVPAGEVLGQGRVDALEFFGDVCPAGACLQADQGCELGCDRGGGLADPVLRVAPVPGQERLLLGGELGGGLVAAVAGLVAGLVVVVFGLARPVVAMGALAPVVPGTGAASSTMRRSPVAVSFGARTALSR